MRDGPYLVVRQRRVELPANCVVCDAEERGRLTLAVRKSSSVLALLGMFGAFVHFSVPSAKLRAGLCDRHLSGERRAQWSVRALLILCVAGVVAAIAFHNNELVAVAGGATAVLLLNAAAIVEIGRQKLLRGVHADQHYLWINNVSPALLDRLPAVGPPQP